MESSPRHETLCFILSVRTLEALHRQHKTYVFLCRKSATKIFKYSSMHGLVLPGDSEVRQKCATCNHISQRRELSVAAAKAAGATTYVASVVSSPPSPSRRLTYMWS